MRSTNKPGGEKRRAGGQQKAPVINVTGALDINCGLGLYSGVETQNKTASRLGNRIVRVAGIKRFGVDLVK